MTGHAQRSERPWKLVDKGEEQLDCDDGVNHAGEDLLGEDGVLFDDFGEVVEAAGDGEGEEEEAEGEA